MHSTAKQNEAQKTAIVLIIKFSKIDFRTNAFQQPVNNTPNEQKRENNSVRGRKWSVKKYQPFLTSCAYCLFMKLSGWFLFLCSTYSCLSRYRNFSLSITIYVWMYLYAMRNVRFEPQWILFVRWWWPSYEIWYILFGSCSRSLFSIGKCTFLLVLFWFAVWMTVKLHRKVIWSLSTISPFPVSLF